MANIVGSAPSSLDHILKIKNEILDRQIVLKGEFKSELERLAKVQAEAEVALGSLKTVQQADQYAEATKAKAGQVMKDALDLELQAKDLMAKAKAAGDELKSREDSAVVMERAAMDKNDKAQQALDRASRLEDSAKQKADQASKMVAMLNERDEKLRRSEDDYRKRLAALMEREAKLNERIETLKATI